jgi:hypothetical protein
MEWNCKKGVANQMITSSQVLTLVRLINFDDVETERDWPFTSLQLLDVVNCPFRVGGVWVLKCYSFVLHIIIIIVF